jgi:hypothetical protein
LSASSTNAAPTPRILTACCAYSRPIAIPS